MRAKQFVGPVGYGEFRPKLKPRWDVHLSGDDDQLGCAWNPSHLYLESDPAPSFAPTICAFHLGFSLGGLPFCP